MTEPKLTLVDRLAIARIEARGIRRAVAGITHQPDIDRDIERVKDRARKRDAKKK
ncbi:hypothetical protein [Streptomyces sp. GbtcB6]|uniref:hypothetical protein n=1 Tax=Streptomyces sp. GbtcB6 TaxID=2824751 RepID=UPI001C30189B|nr:hypothetical protein [Streptomyces sp. GbtcB6]